MTDTTSHHISRRRLLVGAGALGAGALSAGAASALAADPSADAASRTVPRNRVLGQPRRLREYWLAAVPVPANVVPTGRDEMMGTRFQADDTSYVALGYRAYTPGWGSPVPGSADLGPNTGLPGPVLRGEVGDRILVHFRNDDTHYRQPHSIHPHGVRYTPESDGAWTAAEPNKPGTAVPPGDSYTYTYDVLPSSVGTWPYHDHSTPFRIPGTRRGDGGATTMGGAPTMEIGAQLGLVGMLVLTEPAERRPDREFYLVFHDLYSDDIPSLSQDFDCFNGRAFLGNTPTFQAKVGEHVRWHVVALGTEFHVFHVHGHRWRTGAGHTDSVLLGPATTAVADWVEDNPGEWLYHCHVVDHMEGGMVGRYRVDA